MKKYFTQLLVMMAIFWIPSVSADILANQFFKVHFLQQPQIKLSPGLAPATITWNYTQGDINSIVGNTWHWVGTDKNTYYLVVNIGTDGATSNIYAKTISYNYEISALGNACMSEAGCNNKPRAPFAGPKTITTPNLKIIAGKTYNVQTQLLVNSVCWNLWGDNYSNYDVGNTIATKIQIPYLPPSAVSVSLDENAPGKYVTKTLLTASWTLDPNNSPDAKTLITIDGPDLSRNFTVESGQNTFSTDLAVINGMQAGAKYTYLIKHISPDGNEALSSSPIGGTFSLPPKSSAPPNLKVSLNKPDGDLCLSWSSSGDKQEYHYVVKDASGKMVGSVGMTTLNKTCMKSDSFNSEKYTAQVQARGETMPLLYLSDSTEVVFDYPKKETSPSGLIVDFPSSGMANFNWSASDPSNQYVLSLSSNGIPVKTSENPTSRSNLLISGFKGDKPYEASLVSLFQDPSTDSFKVDDPSLFHSDPAKISFTYPSKAAAPADLQVAILPPPAQITISWGLVPYEATYQAMVTGEGMTEEPTDTTNPFVSLKGFVGGKVYKASITTLFETENVDQFKNNSMTSFNSAPLEMSFTYPEKKATPSDLKLSIVQPNAAAFSWAGDADAIYDVLLSGGSFSSSEPNRVNSPSLEKEGFSSGETYTIAVTSVYSRPEDLDERVLIYQPEMFNSDPAEFTFVYQGKRSNPANFKVETMASGVATFSWDAAPDNPDNTYNLLISGGTFTSDTPTLVSSTSLVQKGFVPGESYKAVLTSVFSKPDDLSDSISIDSIESFNSDPVEVTFVYQGKKEKPTGLTYTIVQPDSALFSWSSNADGSEPNYQVTISGGSFSDTEPTDVKTTSLSQSGFVPGETYTISVVSVFSKPSEQGDNVVIDAPELLNSNPAEITFVYQGKKVSPSNLQAVSKPSGSANISWSAAPDNPENKYSLVISGGSFKSAPQSVVGTSLSEKGFEDGVSYAITVISEDKDPTFSSGPSSLSFTYTDPNKLDPVSQDQDQGGTRTDNPNLSTPGGSLGSQNQKSGGGASVLGDFGMPGCMVQLN